MHQLKLVDEKGSALQPIKIVDAQEPAHGVGDSRGNYTTEMSPVELAGNQFLNVLEGAGVDLQHPIMGTIRNFIKGGGDAVERIQNAPVSGAVGMVKDVAMAPVNALGNILSSETTDEEKARGAGQFLQSTPIAAAELGIASKLPAKAAAGMKQSASNLLTFEQAQSLRQMAANNRRAAAAVPSSSSVPLTKPGMVAQGARMVSGPIRRGVAAVESKMADALSPEIVPGSAPPNSVAVQLEKDAALDAALRKIQAGTKKKPAPSEPPPDWRAMERMARERELDAMREKTVDAAREAALEQAWQNRGNFEADPNDAVGNQLNDVIDKNAPTVYRPHPDAQQLPPQAQAVMDSAKINKWMNVSSKDVAHGANPGERIIAENLLGADKSATKANVQSALKNSGASLESQLKQSAEIIDANDTVIDSLSEAKGRYQPKDPTIQKNIDTIWEQITSDYPNLDKLSPLEAQRLKAKLGDSITWKGEAASAPFNQALIRIYRGINQKIKSAVPGAAEELSRWGDLYIGNKSLAESLSRDVVGRGTGAAVPRN